jgi:hypothetical protein
MACNQTATPAEICDRIRCVFGNPLKACVMRSGWLSATVRGIADTIYRRREFDAMLILADALEDAGCDDASILRHCRSTDGHTRGCWVVDCILGLA